MTIDLTGLVRPHVVEMTKRDDNPNAAEFRLQPLERGFGYTLGNSLRRLLLSSLRGSAVWGFRLDGVVHEHQTVQGVLEDVHQIVQRLKALTLVLSEDRLGPAVRRVAEAIALARATGTRRLLVMVPRNLGVLSVPQRLDMVRLWAEASGGRVRVAVVAPAGMLDDERVGTVAAAGFGLEGQAFTDEASARAWLETW